MLFDHSGVNLPALRTVKLSPAVLIRLFRKTCTIRTSGGLVPACQRTHTPRAPSAWATRARLLTANSQRPSARSRHTEFTTRFYGEDQDSDYESDQISAELGAILERLGSSAENWQARLRKLSGGRLLGRFFAATRSRLREVAQRLANLAGCPAR